MRLKSVRTIRTLKNKRVLLRTDFNVPLEGGTIALEGDERILRTLPTIRYLLRRGALVIVATHLGRPGGRVVPRYRLKPLAAYLGRQLKAPVQALSKVVGPEVAAAVRRAAAGTVLMLENLRFNPGEEENSATFSRTLAELCDVYVNDAFGNAHRAHASMVGVPRYRKSYAGLLLAEEVRVLSGLLARPRRPMVAVIGGVKLSTKLAVIQTFLKLANDLLLGGNLANTVLKARGLAVGRSPVEEGLLPSLRRLKLTAAKLHLPVDVITASGTTAGLPTRTLAVANVQPDEYILDVGPDTVRLFDAVLRDARTIVWNGPMGKFELPAFAAGTIGLVHAIAHTRARVVVGGGETVAAVRRYLPKPVSAYPNVYLSTGGGAMLKFLEHGTLPALRPLLQAK
ncbi:MAG: phosphoglycerate kinase [bacterium]|nr:phosphoglycerate kinase [bacterium]